MLSLVYNCPHSFDCPQLNNALDRARGQKRACNDMYDIVKKLRAEKEANVEPKETEQYTPEEYTDWRAEQLRERNRAKQYVMVNYARTVEGQTVTTLLSGDAALVKAIDEATKFDMKIVIYRLGECLLDWS